MPNSSLRKDPQQGFGEGKKKNTELVTQAGKENGVARLQNHSGAMISLRPLRSV